jgi:hypothetical protein
MLRAVSKNEVNAALQTHNGAVACQIIDALHPRFIAFSKVCRTWVLMHLEPGSATDSTCRRLRVEAKARPFLERLLFDVIIRCTFVRPSD